MGLRLLYISNSFNVGTVFSGQNLRRQILTSKDGPRDERVDRYLYI